MVTKEKAPGIAIKNLTLRYANKSVKKNDLDIATSMIFQNYTIQFAPKKCSVILGPSGIGKSTLLHVIAGLTASFEIVGNIKQVVFTSDKKPLTNRLSYMTQKDALFPWLKVWENVSIGSTLRATRDKMTKQKAREILKLVELEQVTDVYPNTLSGGMRQRVALARVLFEASSVVLMDEPFAALDSVTKWRLQTVTAMHLHDTTRILVTHDPLEALRLADNIYLLASHPLSEHQVIELPGVPPRDINDPVLTEQHAELLTQLIQMDKRQL